MSKQHVYHWTFQVVLPQKGEVVTIDEREEKLTLTEFWETFAQVTDWLKDHPERRCVIRRGDRKIDLVHILLERGLWPARGGSVS